MAKEHSIYASSHSCLKETDMNLIYVDFHLKLKNLVNLLDFRVRQNTIYT
jgi:hypothetical protein